MFNALTKLMGLLLLATALVACSAIGDLAGAVRGTGPLTSETRELEDFSGIELSGIGTVIVEQGSEPGVRIEAQESLLPYLETAIEDGTLVIGARQSVNLMPTQGVFFYVTAPRLDNLNLSGLGEINAPVLSGDDVVLRVGGSGSITVGELTAGRLEALLSGLGDLNVEEGAVDQQQVRLTGSGSYNAGNLQSRDTAVTLSGLGSATVHASETLDATITGGGNIAYHGKPRVQQSVSGLGEVVALDDGE